MWWSCKSSQPAASPERRAVGGDSRVDRLFAFDLLGRCGRDEGDVSFVPQVEVASAGTPAWHTAEKVDVTTVVGNHGLFGPRGHRSAGCDEFERTAGDVVRVQSFGLARVDDGVVGQLIRAGEQDA